MDIELPDNVREYSFSSKSKVYLLVYTKQEGDQTIRCRMVGSLVKGDLERIWKEAVVL